MTQLLMVFCTCPESAAENIAKVLLNEKLAACVNLSKPLTSYYHWQGKLEKESEVQLVIKTTKAVYFQLENKLKAIHPYDVPEILAVKVVASSSDYQTWVEENVAE